MARPSVSVSDDLLEDFDDVVWELKVRGELDRDADRSSVIRGLMREFVDEHRDVIDEGNGERARAVAD